MASNRRIVIEFLGQDRTLGKTARGAGDDVDKLGARLRKVSKIAAVGLAGGAVVAGKALFDMGKNAAADAQGQRRLELALKNTANATDDQVAGVEDWISAQGKALGVTDDQLRPALQRFVSVTNDVGKAQKLASLAMDISAGSGKSLESVSAALARAQNGNLTGMARLGVATRDASGETLSLDQVMRNASKTFKGQAAASANSLQGKMGRLKLALDETGEEIGAKLLPVVTRLATWFLNEGMPAIGKFTAFMREKLGPVIEWIRSIFSGSTSGMSRDVTSSLTAIKSIFQSTVAFVQAIWQRFGGTITAFTKGALNDIRTVIGGALQVISGVFKAFAALLKGDWKGVWNGIKQILRGGLTIVRGLLSNAINIWRTLFKVWVTWTKTIWGGMWNGLKSLGRAGINAIVAGVRAIPGRLRALGGVFRNAGRSLIDMFVNGMKNAGGVISGIAGNVWKAVKTLLNGAISKINAALEFKIGIPGPDIHINPPNIPHLAMGTNHARGGWTKVGETGEELVRLPGGSKVYPNHRTRQMTGGGGGGSQQPIIAQLVLDSKVIHQSLVKRKRDTGALLGLA